MGSGWKAFIKCRLGLSLAFKAGRVTANLGQPCLSSPGTNFFLVLQLPEIGKREAGEQMVSESQICDVLGKPERGGVELEAFVSYSFLPHTYTWEILSDYP